MSEKTKIESPKNARRRRQVAAYLAPLIAVGALVYGTGKLVEASTKERVYETEV